MWRRKKGKKRKKKKIKEGQCLSDSLDSVNWFEFYENVMGLSVLQNTMKLYSFHGELKCPSHVYLFYHGWVSMWCENNFFFHKSFSMFDPTNLLSFLIFCYFFTLVSGVSARNLIKFFFPKGFISFYQRVNYWKTFLHVLHACY